MGWIFLAVVAVFYGIGYKLTFDAYHHLRDPNRHRSFTPIFDPDEFTAEGQSARRRAALYWRIGGIALVLMALSYWAAR